MTRKILIVDDSPRIRNLVRTYLKGEGYEMLMAADGREALFTARSEKPDLILLDLMMPNMGGYEFMRVYGRDCDTPIIILTAKLEESDKVLGLELGADDYVTKPFGMRELTARIKAVLRRAEKKSTRSELLRVADISLDHAGRMVRVQDRRVDLTPSEFDLLAIMMAQPGRVFSRAELLDRMREIGFDGYERTIDVHIRNLRAKIEPKPRKPIYVETVYGVGYRFALDSA